MLHTYLEQQLDSTSSGPSAETLHNTLKTLAPDLLNVVPTSVPRLQRTQSWPPSTLCLNLLEAPVEFASEKWIEYTTVKPAAVQALRDDPESRRASRASSLARDNWSTKSVAGSIDEKKDGFRVTVQKRWLGTQRWLQHKKMKHDLRRRQRHEDVEDDGDSDVPVTSPTSEEPSRKERKELEKVRRADEKREKEEQKAEADALKCEIEAIDKIHSETKKERHPHKHKTDNPSPSPNRTPRPTLRDSVDHNTTKVRTSPRTSIERPSLDEARKSDRSVRHRKVTNPPHELSQSEVERQDDHRGRKKDIYLKGFTGTGDMVITREQPPQVFRHRTASGRRRSWQQPTPGIVPVEEEYRSKDENCGTRTLLTRIPSWSPLV